MNRKATVSIVILVALGCIPLLAAQERPIDLEVRAEQLRRARTYADAGRHYEATGIAKRLLAQNADDAEARLILDESTRALDVLQRDRLEAARVAAEKSDATDADRLALAEAHYGVGDYTAAAALFARLPSQVMKPESRLHHARALSWSGEYDEAERIYSDLLQSSPTPELQVEYGRLLSWMGASAASVRVLDSAYRASPTEEAVVALANARAWHGERDRAVALLADFSTAHPNAVDARHLLNELQASPELRLERVDRMIRDEPFNLALRAERARLLFDSGRFAGAQREIDFIRKNSKTPIAGLDELASDAERRRAQEIARLDERRARLTSASPPVMTSGPSTVEDERLSLAKGYTGQAAYDQALELYDEHLRLHPHDHTARLNYARVLSWDRRYDESQRQYELLLRDDPHRADLQYEYAQNLSYGADFVPATRVFRSLTDLSDNPRARLYPDVPEKAHYNLGQIYRWYGWNESAVAQQNQALSMNGDYLAAREELTLARSARPSSQYEATYSYLEDSNDLSFRRTDVEGLQWISQRTAIEGGIGRHVFERGDASASALSATAGARHRFEDRLTGRARVGLNRYDEGIGTRPFFGLGIDWWPNLQTRTALDYNHYDLVYDVFTLASLGPEAAPVPDLGSALSIDDLRARADYQSGGFWSLLGDASYGRISDDNSRRSLHGLASFRVLRSPFVAVKADGRYLSYAERSSRYWSPQNYRSLAGVLHVGGDIRERLHWSVEGKAGRSYERDRSSDIRTFNLSLTVPVGELFDVIGRYSYGKSGRFENFIGGSGDDFTRYWQRQWYVGVRVRQLFAKDDRRHSRHYYYDNRVLTGSPVASPIGETR